MLFLIYYVGESLNGSFIDNLPEGLAMFGIIVVFSVIFGGIQYLMTLAFIWRKIDFDDFKSWLKWILLLPLIFTPVQTLGIWIFYGAVEGKFVDLNESFGLMAFDLFVAYGYVAIWVLGYGTHRLLRDEEAEEVYP